LSFFVLASVSSTPPTEPPASEDSRKIWLESSDGSIVVPVNGPIRQRRVSLLNGFAGLEVAPSELETSGTPGVEGTNLSSVTFPQRDVLLPMSLLGADQGEMWALRRQIWEVTDPTPPTPNDPPRTFRIVAESASGRRQLELCYVSGLEGDELGVPFFDRFVLQALAAQPFPEDREAVRREFPLGSAEPFLSSSAGTDRPWGTRQLAPSTVIGEDMHLQMVSGRPFYPTIELRGPASSATITSSTGLSIHVPAPIPAGQTLRIVTDPRYKSIRLDGALAAGRVARGSRFAPFVPGENVLDVVVPDATSQTLLALEWRGRHRSLW